MGTSGDLPKAGWKIKVRTFLHACVLSCVHLFVTPGTAAHQVSLSIEFSRQEYWSGLPFPPSRDFPDPRIEPMSPASPAETDEFFTPEPPGKGI